MKYLARMLAAVLLLALLTGCGKDAEVQNGQIVDGGYINEYLGAGIALDETWTCELFEGETGSTDETGTKEMVFRAECVDEAKSIDIIYTEMKSLSRTIFAILGEERIIDILLGSEASEEMTSGYEEAGLNDSSLEKIAVTYLGKTHYALKTTCTIDGVEAYVVQLYLFRLGSRGVTITVSAFEEEAAQEVLDLFYSL